ncbi:hypothetical protein [Streptomyces sp. NBC_01089]|uniref:hypothetical protein n=1 Tax=Streptomyces sp. NBC_01089 TaxID=2903747 RepID=UPI0038638733|nr:hypothetical protein OG510_00125 [Streptomyces sp. NBC_01089]WSU46409.1 hypothetical protein OG510_37025 [Streptomyces sp. NBC_01089]
MNAPKPADDTHGHPMRDDGGQRPNHACEFPHIRFVHSRDPRRVGPPRHVKQKERRQGVPVPGGSFQIRGLP